MTDTEITNDMRTEDITEKTTGDPFMIDEESSLRRNIIEIIDDKIKNICKILPRFIL